MTPNGSQHLTPDSIAALVADLRAVEAGEEFPPLKDRDPRTRAGVCALVIEHLSGVVARLPKTADGVPVTPGMLVYVRVGEHVDERRVIGPYGKKALLTHEPARHGAGDGSAHRIVEDCYSTAEAANEADR